MTTEQPPTTGKVLMHFLVSLDGYVAGPGHDVGFMDRTTVRGGLHREYIETTGAILAGRNGFDSAIGDFRPYGGAWKGPILVLTHHPEDARPAVDIQLLSCRTLQRRSASSRPTSRCRALGFAQVTFLRVRARRVG